MTIQSRDNLKKQFLNGMYPPQEDFHDWLDSYFHKNDQIPVGNIEELQKILNDNNTYLLDQVNNIVKGFKAIEYAQQDLLKIILTPFKYHLSVNKIDKDTNLGFDSLVDIVGKVMLLIENVSQTKVVVNIPELESLVNFEPSNTIELSTNSFAEIQIAAYGDHQTIKYRVKSKETIVSDFEFSANKIQLNYPVSRDGLGFSIEDTIEVLSSADGIFTDYQIKSAPSWLVATKGETSQTTNILNLVIDRNRTDDDDRLGEIVLVQNGSNQEIKISVCQKGRLTNGIPTEYPKVDKDVIFDSQYPISQVGEQIWQAKNLTYNWEDSGVGTLSDQNLQDWQTIHPDCIVPTADEFKSVAGCSYGVVQKNDIRRQLAVINGDSIGNENPYKYQLPLWDTDFLELLGFLVAKSNNAINQSTGKSLIKQKLDITVDGYDDVRTPYPDRWTETDSGISERIKFGTDDFALGFAITGNFHANQETIKQYPSEMRLFNFTEICLRDDDIDMDANQATRYASYGVEAEIESNAWEASFLGWCARKYATGFHSKSVRLVRYKELDFDWYVHDTEPYLKIQKGETIPDGYTVLDKGAVRGALFAQPLETTSVAKSDVSMYTWAIVGGAGSPNSKIG